MQEFQVDCVDAHGAYYTAPIQAETLEEARRVALRAGHVPFNTKLSLNPQLYSSVDGFDDWDSLDTPERRLQARRQRVVIAIVLVLLAVSSCVFFWSFNGRLGNSKPAPATAHVQW